MPRKKKNIPNNFRGEEDIFFIKIKKGLKMFLSKPSEHFKGVKK